MNNSPDIDWYWLGITEQKILCVLISKSNDHIEVGISGIESPHSTPVLVEVKEKETLITGETIRICTIHFEDKTSEDYYIDINDVIRSAGGQIRMQKY